jgi:Ca2+-binding EF-hand superfamily protein
MTSTEFARRCDAEFAALDVDGSGTLTPDELYPIVLDLADADAVGVTYEHCERFANLFDTNGDGVISRGEFVEFSQFMLVTALLAASQQ